ncbi:helix-turn-helix domain-containing protein [Micromonospora sp. SD12]|uniref:helix-turn-helix domain-containing protein n=1 Tax=Micromonospora sp. SD12 TaxID=3452216 RepID=UPI003F88CF92
MTNSAADDRTFGALLRRRRVDAGLSLADLAARTGYSKSYLSKVELGTKSPHSVLARRCDAAVDAGGELSRLADQQTVPDDDGAGTSGDRDWLIRLNADGSHQVHALGTALAPLDTEGLISTSLQRWGGSGRPAEQLSAYTAVFATLRELARAADPPDVLPMLISGAGTLRALSRHSPCRDSQQSLRLAARFAELAGWMMQESGDDEAARWWTESATTMAQEAGDRDLSAYTAVRLAELALYRGDAASTVGLADRAAREAPSRRVRGLAIQRKAQGYALAGDYGACRSALDLAADTLRDDDGVSDLGSTTTVDPMALATGWCLYDLGRPGEAAPVLHLELGRLPVAAHRSRARHGARLALSYSAVKEVEQACVVAEQTLTELGFGGSATVRSDLVLLNRALVRWSGFAPVARVRAAIVEAQARRG